MSARTAISRSAQAILRRPSPNGASAPPSDGAGLGRAARLDLNAVRKSFGSYVAVRDVDLLVEAGELVALLGPSGSGKTTLMRLIAGTERLDDGSIHLGGELVAAARHHRPPEHRSLAMVFQDYALWPHMTAHQNVSLALSRLRLGRAVRRRMADRMLERVGLAEKADRRPGELSGGEQQRVALARALVARPSLLLCDEPLSNLDLDLRERMRDEIVQLVREVGSTLLYITHDQTEAFALAERIAIMRAGRIEQLGTPTTVYEAPVDLETARFTGSIAELEGVIEADGVPDGGRPLITMLWRGHRLAASPRDALSQGQAATVIIRPGAATLRALDTSAEAADHARNGARPPWEGIVDHCSFQSGRHECAVEVGHDVILRRVEAPGYIARGTRVHVTLDPAGCLAFQPSAPSRAGNHPVQSGLERPAEV